MKTRTTTQNQHVTAATARPIYTSELRGVLSSFMLESISEINAYVIPALAAVGINVDDWEASIDGCSIRLLVAPAWSNHDYYGTDSDCAIIFYDDAVPSIDWFSEGSWKRFKKAVRKALHVWNVGEERAKAYTAHVKDWPIDESYGLLKDTLQQLEESLGLECDGCDDGYSHCYAVVSSWNDDMGQDDLKITWNLHVDEDTRQASFTWKVQSPLSSAKKKALAIAFLRKCEAIVNLYNEQLNFNS